MAKGKGKGKKGKKKSQGKTNCTATLQSQLPSVSCLCPTMLKRRGFIAQSIHLFAQQDYTGKMEMVVFVDEFKEGGVEETEFLSAVECARKDLKNTQSLRLITESRKIVLGEKRQIMATDPELNSIIVWWDDDDFFYPMRTSYSVKRLVGNPRLRAVGCSGQEMFFLTLGDFYRVEKMPNPNHATCGTMAMWSKLFQPNNGMEDPPLSFKSDMGFAEEKDMLKGYSVPLGQLDPNNVIMIIAHGTGNTVSKEQLVNRKNLQKTTSSISHEDFEKKVKLFTKKDKVSTDFYISLVKKIHASGEANEWRKYRESGRQDIFYINGDYLDPNSETYKRLNGLTPP